MFRFKLPLLVVGFLCVCLSSIRGERVSITLVSGEVVSGDLLADGSQGETVVIASELLGELSFPKAKMRSMEPLEPEVVDAKPERKSVKLDKKKREAAANAATQPIGEAALQQEKQVVDYLDYLLGLETPKSWSGNLRIGMNFSDGDSKWAETYLRGKLEIDDQATPNFYRFEGAYTYRQTENQFGEAFKSVDKYNGSFVYRRSFYEDWFFQNTLAGRVDQRKGIDRELSDQFGVGYSFNPNEQFELIVGGAGGIEDYKAAVELEANGQHGVLSVFEEMKWEPMQRTSLVQQFNYYWDPDDPQRYNYLFRAAVRIRLTDLFGFEFSYNKEFDNDTGIEGQKNDARWLNSVMVYF